MSDTADRILHLMGVDPAIVQETGPVTATLRGDVLTIDVSYRVVPPPEHVVLHVKNLIEECKDV